MKTASIHKNFLSDRNTIIEWLIQKGYPVLLALHYCFREILNGDNSTGDRSKALTTLANEVFGWQNWCLENGVPITGDAENLVALEGKKLGIDSDRIPRILKTIDPLSCQPSAQYLGGEESCWLKIHRLDKGTFNAECRAAIKLEIENNPSTHVVNTFKSSNKSKNTEHKNTLKRSRIIRS